MSKKKKKLDLVENQVIEENIENIQDISISSEEVVKETADISKETTEELSENVIEDGLDAPQEVVEDVSVSSEKLVEKENPIVVEENNHSSNDSDKKKSRKMWLILSLCLFFILFLFLLFSTVFALIYGSKSTIVQGVSIKNIDISSLTREQALEKVLTTFKEKLEQPITLIHNEYETTVFPEQFDVAFALEEAVDMAYAKGRSRKYFSK